MEKAQDSTWGVHLLLTLHAHELAMPKAIQPSRPAGYPRTVIASGSQWHIRFSK